MADRITDERLREIAISSPLELAICAQMGDPSWADVRSIAAELLAARAEIERLRNHIDSAETAFALELGALRLSLKQVDAAATAGHADLRDAILVEKHKDTP